MKNDKKKAQGQKRDAASPRRVERHVKPSYLCGNCARDFTPQEGATGVQLEFCSPACYETAIEHGLV